MKNLKLYRFVAMVLCLVLALGLAACGGSGSTASTGSTGSKANDDEPYEVVIEIMGMGLPQTDVAMVEEEINKITLPAINCTVKFRDIAIADHATQMSLLATGGDQLDIIYVGYTTNVANLKANGLLVPLGDLLKQYAPELLEKAGVLMDACYVTDDYYCVPGNFYPSVGWGVLMDTQVIEENNIKIPENPEASYEYVNKLYDAVQASGFSGYCTSAGDSMGGVQPIGYYMENFGAGMGAGPDVYGVLLDMHNDTKIVNYYDTDVFMEAAKQQRTWWEEGKLDPDSLTSGRTLVDAMRSGMIAGSVNSYNSTYALNNRQITGRDCTVLPFGEYTLTGASIPEYGLGVTVNSKRPDKAVQMLNLISTNVELANLMNYGIEGVHYVKVSEHIIDYPEGVDRMSLGFGNQIGSFGDESLIFHRVPFTEEWYEEVKNFTADNAKVSKAFGYVFDPEPVKTQVASCSAVISEYVPSLGCGLVADVEGRVAELRNALKVAGIDDIIAENQRQFDAWLASK